MHRLHLRRIAPLAGLIILLGGCVADYKRFSEERYSAAPDLSGTCQFQWAAGNAYYRVRDANGFGWGEADKRGHPDLKPYLKDLAPKCPNAADAPRAFLSTHYVEYSNRANRSQMMLPVGFFQLLTLGYVPLELSSFYAACVETTTVAGPRRAAMAHGQLDAVTNVWGASESLLHPGGTMRRQNSEQLLRDLTQQAWHKLWTPGQGLAAGAGCRDSLEALLK